MQMNKLVAKSEVAVFIFYIVSIPQNCSKVNFTTINYNVNKQNRRRTNVRWLWERGKSLISTERQIVSV